MSQLTKKLLGLADDESSSPPVAEKISSASFLGLHDAVLSGWFQNDSAEIFRGIPITAEDRVVDVGCGDGGNSAFCARFGAHVTAIDIDPEVVAALGRKLAAMPNGGYVTHVSDANPLPLADNYATRVLCTEVLEHVDDPAQVLSELVRIGQSGARYLLSVPDALQETMQQHVAPPSYFQKPNHVRIISREQFADMVTGAGLVIEEHTQYGFFWSIWWALFWTCNVDLANPNHPALDHWTEAWRAILAEPQGLKLKKQLDQFMPKSQVIVARKS